MSKNKMVALYLRVSEDDHNPSGEESNSITSQREILSAYIKIHEDLSAFSTIEMLDDGYSGTNFERPGIKSLIEQAQSGTIEAILVKDFSRFGRNYIEVGNFVEQVFPFLGVRFIAVADNFDSKNWLSSTGAISIGLKNLIHDLYSKDLSKKITSVRKSKAEQGKFVTGYAPYGFKKTKEQRLIADAETAPIVKRIFQMAGEGIAKTQIAKMFNAEEIPSPRMFRKLSKQTFACNHVNEKSYWSTPVIYSILKDQRYVGDTVYGKLKPITVGSHKAKQMSVKDWIIVPNTHEQIVERELFDKVKKMGSSHNYTRSEEVPVFSGKIRCGVCNHAVPRQVKKYKTGSKATYRCWVKSTALNYNCYSKSVAETVIENAILQSLKVFIKTIKTPVTNNHPPLVLKEMANGEQSKKRVTSLCLENYEAYKSGKIDKQTFLFKKNASEQKAELSFRISPQEKIVPTTFRLEKLTREIVVTFVESITICENGSLRIKWNFSRPF